MIFKNVYQACNLSSLMTPAVEDANRLPLSGCTLICDTGFFFPSMFVNAFMVSRAWYADYRLSVLRCPS